MIFEVEHTTRYDYSEPVKLEPLALRLRPRSDRSQQVRHFELKLDPDPAGLSEISDLEGNDTAFAWFTDQTTSLEISTRLQAETFRTNAFDYIVLNPASLQVPMRYPDTETRVLFRYTQSSGDAVVSGLARKLLASVDGDGPSFLTGLAGQLADQIEGEVRLEGQPLEPGETLRRGRGSCRDAAVLFMDACRSVGIAARFVSGYQEGDPAVEEKYLHAWAEVYLSGVGWRGFDPTLGLAVSDRHLALAAGPTAASTLPSEGNYRGNAASAMKADLQVKVLPSSRVRNAPPPH